MNDEWQELLTWLRDRREQAKQDSLDNPADDMLAALLEERAATYSEIIQHIMHGGAS